MAVLRKTVLDLISTDKNEVGASQPRYFLPVMATSKVGKWLITMVIVSPLAGVVPFQMTFFMAYKWGWP